MRRVGIILRPPSYIERYQIIPIREDRHLFPKDGVYFKLETDLGVFPVRVMSHKGWPPHIHLTPAKWFEAHRGLKVGDKLVIEVLEHENKREYYLRKLEE